MANNALFDTRAPLVPDADTVNRAGGRAYPHGPKHALAQLAATGTLADTYYADARHQLDEALDVAKACDDRWLLKVATYARKRGHMKDMPALLAALLAARAPDLFRRGAPNILDNGRMVRSFVQILRSGVMGRTAIPRCARTYLREWIRDRHHAKLFRDSVGQSPSMADVIRMVHVKPKDDRQAALLGYMIGKDVDYRKLPPCVQQFERFKREGGKVPDVEFRLLTALDLSKDQWTDIALAAPWHALRMNLNTFQRHGVWEDDRAVRHCADKLRDPEAIKRARVMPYQLLAAFKNVQDVPRALTLALQDAMEVATENVPALKGRVYVVVDVSGSMNMPVTGYRAGQSSKVTCLDVASLVAACVLRQNQESEVICVDTRVHLPELNPRDSVMSNASALAAFGGGGTNLGAAFEYIGREMPAPDLVWLVSDNESWADRPRWGRGTGVESAREQYRDKFKRTRVVCLDIQPGTSTQVQERANTMNVGGFSDAVFDVVAGWGSGKTWVDQIEDFTLE